MEKLTTSSLMRFPQIFTIAIAVALIPLSITSTSYGQAHTKGRKVAPLTSVLKPGECWRRHKDNEGSYWE
jgi:hypothetical protein